MTDNEVLFLVALAGILVPAVAYIRSTQPKPAPRDGLSSDRMKALIAVAIVVAGCWFAWTIAASVYRQQHCVELFGHWLAVDRPSSLICQ